jgi:hypothetical protein
MRKEVVGYKINPLGDHDFYGVDLQPWRASSRL